MENRSPGALGGTGRYRRGPCGQRGTPEFDCFGLDLAPVVMANEVFGDGLLLLIGQLEQELPRLRDVLDDDRALGRDPALNSAHGTGLSLGATTRKMGDRLVKSQEAIARTVRSVFPAAERARDEATAHLPNDGRSTRRLPGCSAACSKPPEPSPRQGAGVFTDREGVGTVRPGELAMSADVVGTSAEDIDAQITLGEAQREGPS